MYFGMNSTQSFDFYPENSHVSTKFALEASMQI